LHLRSNIKEQNQLMVEEIQLQLEQLEIMEKKAKQMHANHVDEGMIDYII